MIKIATRGSKLALWQANLVASKLGAPSEICVIKTTGDIKPEESLKNLGGKEVFTKEIDEALLEGKADIAVHSLKDVPGILHPELEIVACLEREDPRDILIGTLENGGKLGTSSPRRKAQLLALYPNIEVVEFRGNVETRLKKLEDKIVDATVLAAAGIKRLGIEITAPHQYLENIIPCVGQGIICVIAKKGYANLAHINHEKSYIAATAERAVLKAFGGNCYTPIAAHATISESISINGFVASDDAKKSFTTKVSGSISEAEKLGHDLGKQLLDWYKNS